MNQTWRVEYKKLCIADMLRRAPVFYMNAEYASAYVQYPRVGTANGLTMAIIKFLTWKGHYANRISTQGQVKIHKVPRYNIFNSEMVYFDKVQWNKGSTKRGTPDISAIIYGKPVWIEVKIGKDRMSEAQIEQRADIEAAGGTFYIARDMDEFYEWFKTTFEHVGQ